MTSNGVMANTVNKSRYVFIGLLVLVVTGVSFITLQNRYPKTVILPPIRGEYVPSRNTETVPTRTQSATGYTRIGSGVEPGGVLPGGGEMTAATENASTYSYVEEHHQQTIVGFDNEGSALGNVKMEQATSQNSVPSQCNSRLNDIVYVFNRKTGSTTLVTVIDRFARNNKYSLRRQMIMHKTTTYYGEFNMYHINGKNSKDAILPTLGTSRSNRRYFLQEGRTNVFSFTKGNLIYQPRNRQTVYVTIVREPSSNFESVFNFFHFAKFMRTTTHKTLSEYFNKPDRYRSTMRYGGREWRLGRNGQAWHLGLDHRYHNNDAIVDEHFSQLEKEIDLVFVTEYYDHSLILLKKMMCWKMEDILYIARRVRSSSHRSTMSTSLRDKIRKWNNVDVKLYDRFNKTLWAKIKAYGKDFDKDLQEFRTLLSAVSEDCSREVSPRLESSTVKLLKRAGSDVKDRTGFCSQLKAWFDSHAADINGGNHGPGAFSVLPKGVRDPLSGKTTRAIGGALQCIRVNYLKNTKSVTMKGLEVFFSVNSTIIDLPKQKVKTSGLNRFTASYQFTDVSNVQVLGEAIRTRAGYVIESVEMNGGRCS